MKEDIIKYTKYNIFWIALSVAIRQISLSEQLSRYSYYDMEEAREYFNGNLFAERPFLLVHFLYKVVSLISTKPSTLLHLVFMAADFVSAYLLDSMWYFVLSAFLPSDSISLLCLFFAMYHKRVLVKYVSPLIICTCIESTHSICRPGINAYWYINMQMIEQYKEVCSELFLTTHYFLLCISLLSKLASTKLYLAMVFKEFGYKGYLLLWTILIKETKSSKIYNICIGLTILGVALDNIVWYMLVYCGVGNMNFLCWSNLITIISTGIATLYYEHMQKQSRKVKSQAAPAESTA